MSASVTYAVVLTPPGRGAVATVLVTGQRAIELVGPLVFDRAGRPMALSPDERIRLGHWSRPDGEEVVVAALEDGRVEIHCHGGLAASRAVIERLAAAGCRSIDWQSHHAMDQPDPIRRSALAALARRAPSGPRSRCSINTPARCTGPWPTFAPWSRRPIGRPPGAKFANCSAAGRSAPI